MNGNKFLLDTNVIIFHLAGNKNVESLINDAVIYISSITYAELLSASLNHSEVEVLQTYLSSLHVIHTNHFICETAAYLRRTSRLKLPDAIIASTCLFLDVPLVTFDKDFDNIDELNIIKLTI